MMQRCATRRIAFIAPMIPRVMTRVTPLRLELLTTLTKESNKRVRYLGSQLHRSPDRMLMYGGAGGVRNKSTRFVVQKRVNRLQFIHPNANHNSWSIRPIRIKGTQNDPVGGFMYSKMDAALTCSSVHLYGFKQNFSDIQKDLALDAVEKWGVPYSVLDETTKPRVVDSKYHRHKIYAHNFSWSPFPKTNSYVGDADFKWKEDEVIDYANYNATVNSQRNTFRSLWRPSTTTRGASDEQRVASS